MGSLNTLILCILSFAHTHLAKSSSTVDVDVLILGAGASGIGVAETLYKNGIDKFLILDGEDYVGGRIKHVKFADHLAPLGAGWIHSIGEDNSFWVLSRQHNLQVHYDNYSDIIIKNVHDGKVTPNIEKYKKFFMKSLTKSDRFIGKRIKQGFSDLPFHTSLAANGWKATTPESKAAEYFFADFENGISPEVTSAYIYGITGLGQDVIVTDPRGYAFMLEELAKPFKDKIMLKEVVSKISHSSKKVVVETKTGKKFRANFAVISFSSGVLASDNVQFYPKLPKWKTQAINLLPMCHYCKVFMRFPRQFWEDKNYIMLGNNVPGKLVHWQNFEKPTLFAGKNVFLATVTQDRCKELQLKSDQEVIDEIMKILRSAYGKDIPNPIEILRNNWSQNPLFMGSYSNPVIGVSDRDWKALKQPVGKRLWFTGEYTAGEEEYGFTHGALNAGRNQGARIVRCIKKNKCPTFNINETPKCAKITE